MIKNREKIWQKIIRFLKKSFRFLLRSEERQFYAGKGRPIGHPDLRNCSWFGLGHGRGNVFLQRGHPLVEAGQPGRSGGLCAELFSQGHDLLLDIGGLVIHMHADHLCARARGFFHALGKAFKARH